MVPVSGGSSAQATISGQTVCGQEARLVVTALASIEWPMVRDFMLIAVQSPDAALPCEPTVSRNGGLDCGTASSYFYIDYPVTNCLAPPADMNEGVDDTRLFYDPYYYYYSLVGAQGDRSLIPAENVLCGESWRSIFMRTQLRVYCHPDVPLHVRLKPWYEAALVGMTAWLNQRYGEPALWQTLATLERTCAWRDTAQAPLEDTVFYDMVEALRDEAPVDGNATICEWLANEDVTLLTVPNVTLPFYVTHHRDWYFDLFKYMVAPDATMPRMALNLLLMPLILLPIIVISIAFTAHHLYCRPSEESLNQYELVV
jgi:hypothetical protein